MKKYTKEQIIAVAKWIVWDVYEEEGQLYRRYRTCMPGNTLTLVIYTCDLMPELMGCWGRCLIEDKFIETGKSIACIKTGEVGIRVVEHMKGKNWKVLGQGDTAAEAWLDAAVREATK